jgi:pimeloyl-ACP methyl ester carboxylesterase
VQIEGQGPPLLLIHGFGISLNIWVNLIPCLSPHFTLVIPELPGIGGSDSPPAGSDYNAAAAHRLHGLRLALGIDHWNVLGYSSGSRTVEAYLNLDAAAVLSAILLCPAKAPAPAALSLRLGLMIDSRLPQIGDFILTGWRLKFLIRLLVFNLRPNPHAASWMREIGDCNLEILKKTLHDLPGAGGKPFQLPDIPTLWVWGNRDIITPSPILLGPSDRLVNANHSAPVTAAEDIAQVILPFLRQQ